MFEEIVSQDLIIIIHTNSLPFKRADVQFFPAGSFFNFYHRLSIVVGNIAAAVIQYFQ